MDLTEEQKALSSELAKTAGLHFVRAFKMTFADAVHGFREIEAEFVARVGDDAVEALEIKRRIAEDILRIANIGRQPIDVCRDAWHEIRSLGFSNLYVSTTMTWYYADCCEINFEFAGRPVFLQNLISQ
jgi:hypothetical protein